MGDDIQIRTNVWRRLNDQPLSTLPNSEGPEARKRFEGMSKPLLVKRNQIDYYSDCSTEVAHSTHGTFVFWSDRCRDPSKPDVTHWLVGEEGIMFSKQGKAVSYFTQCSHVDGADPETYYKDDLLPPYYVGFLFIDWDQDGDKDIAILLKSGQFVFFKQESCYEECIS